ncbi:2-oxoglutarate dehydrogenase complex dihydrolipoyllysine-residue succinyltransferase [Thiorhodococcus mannitoliphagus]|uniref:Dihydrolipoyllysine-residue succinyltransferase component of 2-oxoglutarate dehydrogenase complex n=1 Tax=Thiorhodococcus mannitoliphagus TaxID=329406 RepID=A0A6P1E0M5_9GAMM|nr:2-oxoglutarate dehydrogenase complex dihydrolipoyllysine-residue succinyltransferase [Thiorhodococcus mannitoliphagus]NEX22022.1 2-oxoglutarate dehydrogenase complex dihydrolipoyllysine-residue succinyltransferase [Thiorhodococcus mannitoliphagus]
MSSEVRVPALPESVSDATVLTWHKQPGEAVTEGESLVELETDKVVLEVPAPMDGIMGEIKSSEGMVVQADDILAVVEAGSAPAPSKSKQQAAAKKSAEPAPAPKTEPQATQSPSSKKDKPKASEPLVTPSARRLVSEMHLDPHEIPGTGRDGRIQKSDVLAFLDDRETATEYAAPADVETMVPAQPIPRLSGEAGRPEQRVPMTRLRARIAERLVQAQQHAALLTTFNEVNLKAVIELRAKYKDEFEQTHGVRLGFMSFFVKAAVEALQRFPVINAAVDGSDILYYGYYDIGIAVSSPRGLVVPILRNCDQLSMSDIEQGIAEFGTKAKEGTLSYEELTGGTFSITNGGVFGSLVSTPILNPPQSAILGMHKIQERPIVEDGQIVAAPMMYLALTYDHRIIDGREAVQCLVTIKETLEDPARLLLRV